MNYETLRWAFMPANRVESELIQRLAFGFGYGWGYTDSKTVQHTDAPYLFFFSQTKQITYSHLKETVESDACRLVKDFPEALRYFNDPESVRVAVKAETKTEVKTKNLTGYDDGSILAGEIAISNEEFEEFVKKRDTLLGKKTSRPTVVFCYTKEGPSTKRYEIELVKDENEWFAGLDIDDNLQYKKFLRSKVVGPIVYMGMTEPE